MQTFFCYLARCNDNSLYIGSCSNIKEREIKHNKGEGAVYTKQRRPVEIIYWEEFGTRAEAMKREKQLKKWSRKKKEWLITLQK